MIPAGALLRRESEGDAARPPESVCVGYSPPPARRSRSTTLYFSVIFARRPSPARRD
ncbi:MAG: hypothetical protein H0V43_06570 [Gemmatimonadales bacterium]|nr:hypothetical protein [Gemmatimonadales bacterium]